MDYSFELRELKGKEAGVLWTGLGLMTAGVSTGLSVVAYHTVAKSYAGYQLFTYDRNGGYWEYAESWGGTSLAEAMEKMKTLHEGSK